MYLSLKFISCAFLIIDSILCYLPHDRSFHNSVIINNRLFIFGGTKNVTKDAYKYSFELFYLDLSKPFDNASLSWVLIPEGNIPVSLFESTSILGLDNSTVYIIGGFIKNKNRRFDYSNIIYIYDSFTNKWSTPLTTGDSTPRQGMRGVINNLGIIYMFGGYNATNVTETIYSGTFYNDMNIFNTTSMTWTVLSISKNLPSKCGGYSANILKNGVIVYIGGAKYDSNRTKFVHVDIDDVSNLNLNTNCL